MQIVSKEMSEMSEIIFWEKLIKYQFVICEFAQSGKG